MKKTIEINYGTSITVNRGNYENFKPMWHQKMTLELNGETQEQIEQLETAEFNRIKAKLDQFAEEEWSKSKVLQANLRVRIKDNKKYPSYSSIANPDPFNIDPDYALRGTEIHRMFNDWLFSGIWPDPQVKLQKLKYEDIKYEEFFETFVERISFKDAKTNIEVFNDKHLYSGEIDLICEVDDLPTLVDLKTGGWDWMQLIAYYKAYKETPLKQLAIFDLKNQKLEILSLKDPKCVDYWEKFLIKRGEFKSRFGL